MLQNSEFSELLPIFVPQHISLVRCSIDTILHYDSIRDIFKKAKLQNLLHSMVSLGSNVVIRCLVSRRRM